MIFRLVLMAVICLAVLFVLLAPVWLRGLRAASRVAPSRPRDADPTAESADVIEGEFRRIDAP